MNISNFKDYIDKTILDRGYDYYIQGNIVEANERRKNEYVFDIEGSDDYEVVVETTDNGEILYSECDCPYDFGPICKHEAAAYFELSDMLNQEKTNNKRAVKTLKPPTLPDILQHLSKDELINIIVNLADKDASLENSLVLKYSKGEEKQELEACKKFIKAIVRKYKGRGGFIGYRDAGKFASELEGLLEKARNTDNILLALDIALLMLDEGINAFQYADDSDGDIGLLVKESIGVIGEIAIESKEANYQTVETFEKLLAQIDSKVFDGWEEFRVDLLHICSEFADDELFRNKLIMKVETMLSSADKYIHEDLLQILFRLLEQSGSKEEVEQFIYKNLNYSSFREILLNRLLKENDYHKVIEIALEGEKRDQQYRGLITQWKKYRYIGYKYLSLMEEQKTLAKELLFDGDFEYYHELKELAEEDQEVFYTNLKKELKTGTAWYKERLLLKMVEEENDLDELLEFVKENPSYLEQYAEKLFPHFKDEVVEMYQEYIKSSAKNSSNRTEYKGVCTKIKKYKKFTGKEKQMELINYLRSLYPKRPAFIDELGKIK